MTYLYLPVNFCCDVCFCLSSVPSGRSSASLWADRQMEARRQLTSVQPDTDKKGQGAVYLLFLVIVWSNNIIWQLKLAILNSNKKLLNPRTCKRKLNLIWFLSFPTFFLQGLWENIVVPQVLWVGTVTNHMCYLQRIVERLAFSHILGEDLSVGKREGSWSIETLS